MSELVKIGFSAETGQLKTAEKDLNRLSAAGGRADKANSSLGSSFVKLAGTVGLAAAALASLSKITAITREFNVLNAQLITATGSSENAAKAFEAIQEFAQKTPYDLQQVTKGFTQLVNLGLTPSEKALMSYGNTASAMGKDLSQLIEAVADAATGEFERLKEFGIKTKTQGDNLSFTFRGMNTTVKNNAAEIEGYLMSLGENEFAGAMAQRMDTLDGKMSNLSDEWDSLFRNISSQGVGDLIKDGVELGIVALQELNTQVASGELSAELDAIGLKFEGFGRDISSTLDILTPLFYEASNEWGSTVRSSTDHMLDGFINMPENIRALVRLVTVELAHMVDIIPSFGDALDQSVGAVMVRVIKKGEAYGTSWADALNPFSDGSFDLQSELDEVDRVTGEMIDSAWSYANEKTSASQQARFSVIEDILAERDADVDSFEVRIKSANELRKSYDNAQKARSLITGDRLAGFKVGGSATPSVDTAAIKKAQKELDKYESQLSKLEDTLDPVSAATREFDDSQKLLNKALAAGDINAVRYDFLMSQLDETMSSLADNDLDALIDKASDFGGAWSQAGSDIVNAFGSAASVLDDFGKKMEGITALQNELTLARANYQDGTEEAKKADKALLDLSQQALQSNIGAVSKLAGVTAGAFKEQSKERKALHRIETTFAAIEIALAIQKASANAMTAVTAAFAAPFPVGFAAGASMIAIMAGLGFSSGSSGGYDVDAMQKSQGTGTVLGSDDKSESIVNAMEEFNDIGIDQLAELKGIKTAMVSLSNGIAQLAVSLVSSSDFGGGGIQGLGESQNLSGVVNFADKLDFTGILGAVLGSLFGSTKRAIVDSGIQFDSQSLGDVFAGNFEALYYSVIETTKKKFFGLSKKTSNDTVTSAVEDAILNEFGQIFTYVGSAVTSALDVLGIQSQSAIEDYVLKLGSISFKDMSGEEIQKELESIFSQQADLIAKYMLPQIARWQKMGEGSFEALTRVAREQAIFNDALDHMGMSLGDVSSIMQIDIAQSIIDLMGGVDALTSATSEYFSKFFSESEQFAALSSSIGDVFSQLGVSMPMTRESFKELVAGLDLTTEAGQLMFAALMQLVPSMDSYLSELEKQQEAAEKLLIDTAEAAFKALQKAIAAEKTRAQEAYKASQEVYRVEIERINGVRASIEQIYETLNENARIAEEGLIASFDAEKEKVAAALEGQAQVRDAELSRIEGLRSAIEQVYETLQSNVELAKDGLVASFGAERERIELILSGQAEVRDAELARLDAVRGSIESVYSGLNSNLSSAKSGLEASFANEISLVNKLAEQRKSALQAEASVISASVGELLSLSKSLSNAAGVTGTVKDALAAARAGDFSLAKQLSPSDLSASSFSSEADMKVAQALQSNRLLEISKLASSQASVEEMMLTGINNQVAAIDSQTLSMTTKLADQLNALLGIDTTVLSTSDAIAAYQAAQLAIDEYGYESQIASLEALKEAANEAYNQAALDAEVQIAALDAQLNAILNIDTTILSLSDAITAYNAAQLELSNFNYDGQLEALTSLEQAANALYDQAVTDAEAQIAALDAQLNALLGIDTNVLSISEAIAAYNKAQLELDLFGYDAQIEALARQEELAMQLLDIAEQQYIDEIARLDLILADGEAQLNVLLGIDTSVLSVAEAVLGLRDAILAYDQSNAANAQSSPSAIAAQEAIEANKSIAEEIKKMREENNAAQLSIAKSSERTSKVLTRIEGEGLETR